LRVFQTGGLYSLTALSQGTLVNETIIKTSTLMPYSLLTTTPRLL
jgi:hypothetical protein